YWLAKAKRRAAAALKSRALEADSFQTSACFWLSIVGLAGVGLNAAFGFWWADPVAAIGITVLLVKEGREGLRGESCCDVDDLIERGAVEKDECCDAGRCH
ncbi:MAG: hypothetical protein H0T79_04155, partial [Deltaproteobacteria bacterium]|nr:hypothetical protein [Deltaproteobacteria bacterium]